MPEVIETTVFQFDELSDSAKEKARDWYREGRESWELDSVIEDFEECARILGVEISHRSFRTVGGSTGTEPEVYWGLYTQGSGASFRGTYRYAKQAPAKIAKHTGNSDPELIRIAQKLQVIQARYGYGLEARMVNGSGSNFYAHSGTMAVEVQTRSGDYPDSGTEAAVTQLMRDLADWLYKRIQEEDEFQSSDEQVDESIRMNEYTFTAEGKRFG